MRGQLCVNQGAFRTSGTGWAYGLEYIAANVQSPTVVLHWPSRLELIWELLKTRFDLVGITYNLQLISRLEETVSIIRKFSPRSKIVLGGYGTAVAQSTGLGDYVCQGEGIAFMRDLLKECRDEPVRHPTIIYDNHLLSLPVRAGRKLVLCTGLGCPEGCDFCAPSHYFRRRYLPFVENGSDLFLIMNGLFEKTGIDEFQIFDENFLVHSRRAFELADISEHAGRSFEFFTFASLKSLGRFSAEDLIRIGVSAVWIGLEGKQADYDKLHGERLKSLVRRLTESGILVCGSMIIGFDYQTPRIIHEELEEILDAGLTYFQCLIYGPSPNTPLFDQIERQGRWLGGAFGSQVPFSQCDGFALTFEHPHMEANGLQEIQKVCYERDLHHGGHSIFRAIETWWKGYSRLKNSKQPFLRGRAKIYERKLRASRPLIPVGAAHSPNRDIAERLERLHHLLIREFGPLSRQELLLAKMVFPIAAKWTSFCLENNLFQQPALIRRTYRC